MAVWTNFPDRFHQPMKRVLRSFFVSRQFIYQKEKNNQRVVPRENLKTFGERSFPHAAPEVWNFACLFV